MIYNIIYVKYINRIIYIENINPATQNGQVAGI